MSKLLGTLGSMCLGVSVLGFGMQLEALNFFTFRIPARTS